MNVVGRRNRNLPPSDAAGPTRWWPILLALIGAGAAVIFSRESILALCLVAAGVYFGWRRPDLGIALIALSVPIQRTLLVGFGDTTVTITKVVLWATLAGWALSLVFARDRVRVNLIVWGLVAVTGGIALSGWNARDGGLWIGETYRWASMVPVAIFAVHTFMRGWSPVPFLLSAFAGTLFSVGMAIWQVFHGIGPPSFESRGLMRATGPFGHPNQLAIYLELTTPLMLGVALKLWRGGTPSVLATRARRFSPLWVSTVALGLSGLLLSQSRGGGVGMAAGLLVVLAFSCRIVVPHTRVLVGATAIAVLVGSAALVQYISTGAVTSSAREIQVTSSNFAVEERLAHWAAGVEMAVRNPVLGVGAGNFDINFREATTTWRFRIGRGHAHNSYVQMLAQAGVVGFGSYMLLICSVTLTLSSGLRVARSSITQGIAVGAAGMSAAILTHALFEYVHVLSLNLFMAIVWGLVAAIATGALDEPQHRHRFA